MAKKKQYAPRLDDFVEQMIGGLRSYGEIVDIAMAEFGCAERTVTTAIARVRERWKALEAATVIERRSEFRGRLLHAWRGALAEGDYRAIAVMARTLADIEGIKAPKETKHTHGGTVSHRPVAAMSPQERQRELEILLAKRQAELGTGAAALPAIALDDSPAPADVIDLPPDIRPEKAAKGKQGKPRAKASKPRSKTRVH
jgi:hypothetical protein